MAYTYPYDNDHIKKKLLFDRSHKDSFGRTVTKQMPFCLVYFIANDHKTMKGPFISPESSQDRVLGLNTLATVVTKDPPIDIIGFEFITAPARFAGWPGPNGHFSKMI